MIYYFSILRIEAEYRALANTTSNVYWLFQLLYDYHVYFSDPPALWCENIFAISLANNSVFHVCTKHIEIGYHFILENVLRKNLLVKFILSKNQVANLFTKGLSYSFQTCCDKTCDFTPVPSLKGCINFSLML